MDLVQTAVDQMSSRWAHLGLPRGRWFTLDAENMSATLGLGSFDAVVDKGLMDSFELEGKGYKPKVASVLDEVQRVLQPGGVHLIVSSCNPSMCREHLQLGRTWNLHV